MSDDLRFDVRVLKYRLRRGEITESDYNAFLNGLPDDAANGEATTTQFVATTPGARGGAIDDDPDAE